jgi:hypothetical protein
MYVHIYIHLKLHACRLAECARVALSLLLMRKHIIKTQSATWKYPVTKWSIDNIILWFSRLCMCPGPRNISRTHPIDACHPGVVSSIPPYLRATAQILLPAHAHIRFSEAWVCAYVCMYTQEVRTDA